LDGISKNISRPPQIGSRLTAGMRPDSMPLSPLGEEAADVSFVKTAMTERFFRDLVACAPKR